MKKTALDFKGIKTLLSEVKSKNIPLFRSGKSSLYPTNNTSRWYSDKIVVQKGEEASNALLHEYGHHLDFESMPFYNRWALNKSKDENLTGVKKKLVDIFYPKNKYNFSDSRAVMDLEANANKHAVDWLKNKYGNEVKPHLHSYRKQILDKNSKFNILNAMIDSYSKGKSKPQSLEEASEMHLNFLQYFPDYRKHVNTFTKDNIETIRKFKGGING